MSQDQAAPVPAEYTDLTIEGWNEGFRKVSFTHLLQREAGLALADAKRVTDAVLEGQQVRVKVPTQRRVDFIKEAEALGIRDIHVS